MFRIFTILCFILKLVTLTSADKKVCFSQLGCFYKRPLPVRNGYKRPFPKSPKQIGTTFNLYTRLNSETSQQLSYHEENLNNSNFNKNQKTVIIAHGFFSNGQQKWIKDVTRGLLSMDNFNVIVVDWRNGAGKFGYVKAMANTRVVGAQVALLVKTLEKFGKADRANMHLIGYSLGAHLAGFAGKRLKGLARITGLDPAGIGFETVDESMRLHYSDANYVDVIHTNVRGHASPLGIKKAIGHSDFYPNGGSTQPDCRKIFEPFCSHGFATDALNTSIWSNPPEWAGKPCPSYDQFIAGECEECRGACNQMGYYSEKPAHRTTYYMSTLSTENEKRSKLFKTISDLFKKVF